MDGGFSTAQDATLSKESNRGTSIYRRIRLSSYLGSA
jgi:hypothetical protein